MSNYYSVESRQKKAKSFSPSIWAGQDNAKRFPRPVLPVAGRQAGGDHVVIALPQSVEQKTSSCAVDLPPRRIFDLIRRVVGLPRRLR